MKVLILLAAGALLSSVGEGTAQLVTTNLLREYRGVSVGKFGVVEMIVTSNDGFETDLTAGLLADLRELGVSQIQGDDERTVEADRQSFVSAVCTIKEWIPMTAPDRIHWMMLTEISWWNPTQASYVELWEQIKQGYVGTSAHEIERYVGNCAADISGVLIQLGL
jgi:hypothetical protein